MPAGCHSTFSANSPSQIISTDTSSLSKVFYSFHGGCQEDATVPSKHLSDIYTLAHFQKCEGLRNEKNMEDNRSQNMGFFLVLPFAMAGGYHCIFSRSKNMDESQTGYFVFLLLVYEKRIYWS